MSLTLNLDVAPDDTVDDLLARARRRLGELRRAPLPLLDPDPAGTYSVLSPMPPAHYEEAVARAVRRIRAGELEKVVLARDVEVQRADRRTIPAAVLACCARRSPRPTCSRSAAATPRSWRPPRSCWSAARASAPARLRWPARSAEAPTRRSTTISGEQLLRSDKDREENAIVARRIVRALAPHAVWVTAAPDPVVVRVANIQHLATPIRAQLASPIGAIELAGRAASDAGRRRRAGRAGAAS